MFITLPFPSVHGNKVVEASAEEQHYSQPAPLRVSSASPICLWHRPAGLSQLLPKPSGCLRYLALAGVNYSIFQQHSTHVAAAAYMKHEKSNCQTNLQYCMLDIYLWHS